MSGDVRMLSDWDLHRLVRRRLAERPQTQEAWQSQIEALHELAGEIRERIAPPGAEVAKQEQA